MFAAASRRALVPALRQGLTRSFGAPASGMAVGAEAPLVEVVRVTLVDYTGNRHTVAGRVGQSLTEIARGHEATADLLTCDANDGGNVDEVAHTDAWTETLFGEGAMSAQSHVVLPQEWADKFPAPSSGETAILEEWVDEEDLSATSRLACALRVTKELDGMVAYIPDPPLAGDN